MFPAPRSQPIIVKRYARSRLGGRYVSADELRGWAAAGVAFVVVDAETGAGVTRVLLA
jgi:polyhydroxyalkanoate synthesis regulator protein